MNRGLEEAICTRCHLPILRKIEVTLNGNPFHPGCAVEVVKERITNGKQTSDTRRGDKDYKGRPKPDTYAA